VNLDSGTEDPAIVMENDFGLAFPFKSVLFEDFSMLKEQ